MSKHTLLPLLVMGLALLTLLTPCSVRNAIQLQLDLPVTQKLNPSKTTVAEHAVCTYSDQLAGQQALTTFSLELAQAFLLVHSESDAPAPSETGRPLLARTVSPATAKAVPIYILYRQMKTWL